MTAYLKDKIGRTVAALLLLLLPSGPISVKAGASLSGGRPEMEANKGLLVEEDSPAVTIEGKELCYSGVEPIYLTYVITALPDKGVLFRSGKIMNFANNYKFTQADIDAGLISYMPLKETSGQDGFSFTVGAGAGSVKGAFAIIIEPHNDPPELIANRGLGLNEGGAAVIKASVLETKDPDQKPSMLKYTLTAAPEHGRLYKNQTLLKEADYFTQEDINCQLVSYAHDGSETVSDGFGFTVADGSGGTVEETLFAINIKPVDDAPLINKCGPLSVMEGSPPVEISISSSDEEASPLSYAIDKAPEKGMLLKKGAALGEKGVFTQAELDSGLISYVPRAGLSGEDGFEFSVSDGHNGVSGIFRINITPANRAPVITSARNVSCAGGTADVVYTAEAADSNGDRISWSISGPDSALMDIDVLTGELRFIEPPLYFRPLDSDKNNAYEITLTASDGRLSSEAPIKITVEQCLYSSAAGVNAAAEDGGPIKVLIDGSALECGTLRCGTDEAGRAEAEYILDSGKLAEALEGRPAGAVVLVPMTVGYDVAETVLTGDAMKLMGEREARLVLETSEAAYALPAERLDAAAAADRLGTETGGVEVAVKIARPEAGTAALIESAAEKEGCSIIIPATDFAIYCSGGGKTLKIDSFDGFVERLIALPDGVETNAVATGVTVRPDGTAYPVPTQLISIGGRSYAKLSSFTNSVYALVEHEVRFRDVEKHWARDLANEMGARMIFSGSKDGRFEPDRPMTRAEFAAVMVRALGLAPRPGKSSFGDVSPEDWYCGYIETAVGCGLLYGYGDGTIGADEARAREQEMTMIARAMKLSGLAVKLDGKGISQIMTLYKDGFSTSRYAGESVAACVYFGLAEGDGEGRLRPKDFITRAEVAALVRRLLLKADLI